MNYEKFERYFENQKENIDVNSVFTSNNKAIIIGEIEDNFTFSHETKGKNFYKAYINSKRLSGVADHILLLVSEELKSTFPENVNGKIVRASGIYVSSNIFKEDKNHLLLYFYAKDVSFLTREKEGGNNNLVYLKGHICRKPKFRYTPLDCRISDVMLAVDRDKKRTDYIPLIFWGDYAENISNLEVGTEIEVFGRIQSRKYIKTENNKENEKEAYEVSCAAYKI